MNILVTLDSNYITQLSVMLKSLISSNYNNSFNVYVLHSSLTDYDFVRIKNVSPKIIVHPIKVNDAIFEKAHFTKRITKETYYRLLLGDLLPKSVHRILYLDPDVVIIKPLDKLYNIDFNGNVIAGAGHTGSVVEWFNKKRLNMPKSSKYINAGVLMVNVDEFRKVMNTHSTFDYVDKMGAKLFQADQDVLNALLCNHTIYLDEKKYNLDEHIFKKEKLTPKQVILYSSIVHYDGKNKPWKENYKGTLGFLYDYYENKNLVGEGNNEIQATIPA